MWRSVFWILVHNVLVHPLHGLAQAAALIAERAHEFSAERMGRPRELVVEQVVNDFEN
jgi:hypothetical protein